MGIFMQQGVLIETDYVPSFGEKIWDSTLTESGYPIVNYFPWIVLFLIAVYVYVSFAFMFLSRKNSLNHSWIAWIPVVGPLLISSRIAGMHWWPILLLIGIWIPYANIAIGLALAVFFVIWMWRTFESVDRPGWWALLSIIPAVNLVFLVLLGIASFSKK